MKHNSIIRTPGITVENPQFPLLAEGIETPGKVVVFISERLGTCICDPSNPSESIELSDGWYSCFDQNKWTILPKGTTVTIELTQE